MLKRVNSKKGAMELSISTIVIVVLAVSMLILGLVLLKSIMSTSTKTVTQVDGMVENQLSKLFGDDKRLVIYPDELTIKLKVNAKEPEGFAIGIKNMDMPANTKFAYKVYIPEGNTVLKDCGVRAEDVMNLIASGSGSEGDIPIFPGDVVTRAVLFDTKTSNPPLCTVKFRVEVTANSQAYDSRVIYIAFIAK